MSGARRRSVLAAGLTVSLCVALACGGGADGDAEADDVAGAWLTYESPAGFTIEYPPSWEVEEAELSPGSAKILNELRQRQTALEGGDSGEAWVEIIPDAFPRFDLDELRSICRSEDDGWANSASETTLAGRPALLCAGEGTDVYSNLPAEVDVNFVDNQAGGALHIATYALDADEETKRILGDMLETVSFQEIP